MSGLDDPILKPFVDAAIETLETMAMMNLVPGDVSDVEVFENTLDYTASMGLCGENEGLLMLSFGEELSRKIVAGMLGEDEASIDEDSLTDGVGEIANMIAGSAKTTLGDTGYKFELSIPAVITGQKNAVRPGTHVPGHRIECSCEGRDFVMAVWTGGLGSS